MKCLVQVWCEIDPTLNVRVDRQTAAPLVDEGDSLMRVSPLGRLGIGEALRLGAGVKAFALGDGHEAALRHALAAGASHAVKLGCPESNDHAEVVAALADWIRAQNPHLVIAGGLAGRIAARNGWAHLAGLDQLSFEGGGLAALRVFGRGAYEKVRAKLPAVVRLQTESPRPPYVAQARLALAGARPIEETALAASTPSAQIMDMGPLQMSRPRTRLGVAPATSAPAKATDRLNALMGIGGRPQAKPAAAVPEAAVGKTPDQLAEEFVRYLAHHNLL